MEQVDPLSAVRSQPDDYSAQTFLTFEYPETKDLCKQFLTLITGVLAFSVTFSDKIVPPHARHFRILLVISWFMFLVAIIGTGIGLYQIFVAGQKATHSPTRTEARDFNWSLSYRGLNCAGAAFVLGLLLLIISGLSSVL
jgi:hypothetical protein